MRHILIIVAIALLFPSLKANAAIVNAASTSYADVKTAYDAASPGDTVQIPAGSSSWDTTLLLDKAIILQGAGIDVTTLINGKVNAGNGDYIVQINPATIADNPYIEVTAITFDCNSEGGAITIRAEDVTYAYFNFRIHGNKLKDSLDDDDSYMCIRAKGDCFGLIDNNQFVNNYYDFKLFGDDQNSWDNYPGPDNMGSVNFLYIENNTSTGADFFISTSGEGARWVYRYNTTDVATITGILDAHGNTQNDGVVGYEVYENVFTNGTSGTMVDMRGGVGLVYNNDWQMSAGKIQIREEDCYVNSNCDYPGEDPITDTYIWNNTRSTFPETNLSVNQFDDEDFNIIDENRDWWDDATGAENTESPLNFAYDVAASRPGTCTTDDCYWETDNKKLYRCTATDTWTLAYEPFIYPHPLTVTTIILNSSSFIGTYQ